MLQFFTYQRSWATRASMSSNLAGLATEALDLCPSGEPRFNVLPKSVVCN